MKKTILVAVPVALIALGVISTRVFAQTQSGRQNLVQQLAVKLGLSEDKVQSAFDEIRSDRQAEMQAAYEQRLNRLVTDGKITGDQKNKILAKHQEIVTAKNSSDWQNLTPAERRQQMQQQRADLEKWAADNGLDLSLVWGFGQKSGGGMHRGGNGRGFGL